jgi:hypothetical protein
MSPSKRAVLFTASQLVQDLSLRKPFGDLVLGPSQDRKQISKNFLRRMMSLTRMSLVFPPP